MPLLVRLRSESVDCQAQILTSPVEAETRRSQKIPLLCLFEFQQKHLYVYRTEQINLLDVVLNQVRMYGVVNVSTKRAH